MPTVTYTNNPSLQGQANTVYAPDLPWWVNEPQPVNYSGGYNENYLTQATQSSYNEPTTVAYPTTRSRDLSIDSLLGSLDVPVYGGGGGGSSGSLYGQSMYAGSSQGATQYTPPIGQLQYSKTTKRFTGTRPTLTLPKRNEMRVRALRQAAAAPGVRQLRSALNRALVRSYENPNVARMIARSSLAGYGQGLENVLAGAARTAEAEYASEQNIATQEALANYQSAMQEYLASGETVQESGGRNVYAGSSEELKNQLTGGEFGSSGVDRKGITY